MMPNPFNKIIFVFSILLLLDTPLLAQNGGAADPFSHMHPILTADWWEIPAQPPEKWFYKKREEDEWYQRRNKRKYENPNPKYM